ncbi:MAG: DUF1667 domain-containing protein [Candidatus Omnitrophota bacterium]
MIKHFICIECPVGCHISIDVENCRVVKITGNECPKGETYAVSEIENPKRILTATVCASGLSLKMLPVRTDKPIPKGKIPDAMDEIKRIVVRSTCQTGDIVRENFLGTGANLIATREVHELKK